MRMFSLGLVVALAGAGLAAQQMTAKQVVDHSLAARGGAAQFAAVHSLSFTGVISMPQGQTAPIAVWTATSPARVRIEITTPQGKLVEAFDGKTAWEIPPGQTQAQVLGGAEARRVEDEAITGVDLIADRQAQLTLAGTGKLDGHDYYKVQVTVATGDVYTLYFDAHTWLVFHQEYPAGAEDVSGYQRFGALLLPTLYVSGPAGQSTVTLKRTRIVLNPAVKAAQFAKP